MPYSRDDFTDEFSAELVAEHGNKYSAAKAIVRDCVNEFGVSPAWRTVVRWIHDGSTRVRRNLLDRANPDHRNRIEKALTEFSIPPERIKITGGVMGTHGGFIKDKDGKVETVPLWNQRIKYTVLDDADDAPPVVIEPAQTTIAYYEPPVPYIGHALESEVIVSDMQVGFLRPTTGGALEPIHDPHAIDVACQVFAAVQPHGVVFIGDGLDATSLSKYRAHPEFRATLQESIYEGHRIYGEIISACGPRCTRRRKTPGNHDARFQTYIIDHANEFAGIRPATDPTGPPVTSIEYLLGYRSLGLEVVGQFPGGTVWITDDLAAQHAPAKKREFDASYVHGHMHRVAREGYTVHGRHGRRIHYRYDTGCLCRVDFTADPYRMTVTQTPSDRGRTDFQQGVTVVEILKTKVERHQVHQIHIIDGLALYGGQVFRSSLLPEAA